MKLSLLKNMILKQGSEREPNPIKCQNSMKITSNSDRNQTNLTGKQTRAKRRGAIVWS